MKRDTWWNAVIIVTARQKRWETIYSKIGLNNQHKLNKATIHTCKNCGKSIKHKAS